MNLEELKENAKGIFNTGISYQKAENDKRFPNFVGPNSQNRQRPNGASGKGKPAR